MKNAKVSGGKCIWQQILSLYKQCYVAKRLTTNAPDGRIILKLYKYNNFFYWSALRVDTIGWVKKFATLISEYS